MHGDEAIQQKIDVDIVLDYQKLHPDDGGYSRSWNSP